MCVYFLWLFGDCREEEKNFWNFFSTVGVVDVKLFFKLIYMVYWIFVGKKNLNEKIITL